MCPAISQGKEEKFIKFTHGFQGLISIDLRAYLKEWNFDKWGWSVIKLLLNYKPLLAF